MTVNDYKVKHASALKVFLSTEAGKELITTLHQLAPSAVMNNISHIHSANMERRAGFENCEAALIFLSSLPIVKEEIEMTYGVSEIKPK